MDDGTYHRLVNSCTNHFLKVLGPRLDEWAEGKVGRWTEKARDEQTVEQEGRAHWQFEDHEDFRNLFEDLMAVFLRGENCTQADFISVLTSAHAEGGPGTESLGSLVIETMTAIDDFESFVNFMDNAVAGDSDDDDDGGGGGGADDRSRGEEEGKRSRRQDSQEESERD